MACLMIVRIVSILYYFIILFNDESILIPIIVTMYV